VKEAQLPATETKEVALPRIEKVFPC